MSRPRCGARDRLDTGKHRTSRKPRQSISIDEYAPWCDGSEVLFVNAGQVRDGKFTGDLCAGAQRLEKCVAVDAMLAAGIVHGMETGDRTADAAHLELKEHPDRLRRTAHDIIDQVVKSNDHAHLPSEVNANAAIPKPVCPGASLRRVPGARAQKSNLIVRLIDVRVVPIATKFRNAMECRDGPKRTAAHFRNREDASEAASEGLIERRRYCFTPLTAIMLYFAYFSPTLSAA